MAILLGAIADDFTGATDLANTLVGQGMRAVQVIGVPEESVDLGDAEAVVVALKSRTAPVAEAVASSLAALAWLRENIHSRGRRTPANKLCGELTGAPLSHRPLMRHLDQRLRPIYGLPAGHLHAVD